MKGNEKERRRWVPCTQRISLLFGSGSELGLGVDFVRIRTTFSLSLFFYKPLQREPIPSHRLHSLKTLFLSKYHTTHSLVSL